MNSMDQLIAQTRKKVRWLRAFRWGGWGLLGTLAVSLGYLLASKLGWIGLDWDSALLFFNAAGFGLGALTGGAWPVHTRRMLLEMDKTLNTGEVLLTLHHLQQKDKDNDFTSILNREFQALAVQPEAVFHINRRDWKRSGGVGAALLLVVLLVWAGPIWLPRLGGNTGAFGNSGSSVESSAPAQREVPEAFQEQLDELQSRLQELGLEQQISQGDLDRAQNGLEPQDQLIELFEDLERAQNQALGLEGGEGQRPGPAQLQQQRQQQRQALEDLQQQLEQMVMQGADGDPSNSNQELAESLREQLNSLPEGDPLRQHLEDALRQQDSQARQQALEQGQQQLDERLSAERNLDDLRESLEEWANNQQLPGQDGEQTASNNGVGQNDQEGQNGQNQEGQNQNQGDQDGELGESASENSDNGEQGQESPQEDQSALDRPGEGVEAGIGSGQDDQATRPQQWDPEYKNATIPPGMVPADSVEQWLSRGVPVETSDAPGQGAQFRLSFDQVEALLNLRELSPELRDVVRLYFLQIIGELNQGASSETETTEETP